MAKTGKRQNGIMKQDPVTELAVLLWHTVLQFSEIDFLSYLLQFAFFVCFLILDDLWQVFGTIEGYFFSYSKEANSQKLTVPCFIPQVTTFVSKKICFGIPKLNKWSSMEITQETHLLGTQELGLSQDPSIDKSIIQQNPQKLIRQTIKTSYKGNVVIVTGHPR